MTDSEVKPSSPTTEAGTPEEQMRSLLRSLIDGDDAPIPEAEDTFDAALQQAREGGYSSGLLEGRREAVRDLNRIRGAIMEGTDSDTGDVWLHRQDADILRGLVAGLEAEGRSPIGSNASESPPTHAPDCYGKTGLTICRCGDASESPPLCDQIVNNGFGEPTECGRTLPCPFHRWPFGDASESPPTHEPDCYGKTGLTICRCGDASESPPTHEPRRIWGGPSYRCTGCDWIGNDWGTHPRMGDASESGQPHVSEETIREMRELEPLDDWMERMAGRAVQGDGLDVERLAQAIQRVRGDAYLIDSTEAEWVAAEYARLRAASPLNEVEQ